VKRRKFLAQGATGATALLTACRSGSRASIGSSTTGTALDESRLTAQNGGTFQTVGYRILEHLNPWKVVGPNFNFYFKGVYDTLVTYEYKPFTDYRNAYKLVGRLAASWEQPEPTTYIFHMRPNVTWHDGVPFTADDVRWSFQYMADPANRVAAGDLLRSVTATTMPDDHTLQVTMKQPQAGWLDGMIATPVTAILPRHVFDRGDEFEKVAVGTGPFKVASYDQQKGVSYSANKQFYQPGRPYLDGWKLLAPTDEAGRLAGFSAGQNDVLHLTDKRQADTIVPLVKGALVWEFAREITADLYLKLDKPPFNDKRVRQAVQTAIDRRDMLKTLHSGDGLMNPPGINAVATGWALPQSELDTLPGWSNPKDKDIQLAKQLLEQAGYGNGSLSFRLTHDQTLDYVGSEAIVLAAQLRKVGITVNVQPLEQAIHDKNLTSGDYTADLDASGTSSPQNNLWLARYHSGGFKNKMPVNDPEADRLLDEQLQEFDITKRKAICQDFERLLGREVYVIPLTADPGYLVLQPYVHGWNDGLALNVNDTDWGETWFDQKLAPKLR
jgi:peptide/nickel transport system substrate-binding protein